MGTNYYTKNNRCTACGHKPEGIHLGKSSEEKPCPWHDVPDTERELKYCDICVQMTSFLKDLCLKCRNKNAKL